ncbi:MAG: type II toxin-antitoxin system VapC family toxin [Methylocystis sp.]|uniref:type II toxin-antitoxin system VapC family toxin n=1 Tax=Methylocystis sp. TaxID=1911079 RepID=UPI003D112E21
MIRPKNVFWDSCCFIRFITRYPELLADMEQYIKEAREGSIAIHFCTIAFAEIRPRYFKESAYGSIEEFFDHWGSAFVPIDPNANILIEAGRIRDVDPINPADPNIADDLKRKVGAADAIHLSACLFLRDAMGLNDIVFHTFDEGKGKTTSEGKCVPIIGFERWFPAESRSAVLNEVCSLTRCKPKHYAPDLATGASHGG